MEWELLVPKLIATGTAAHYVLAPSLKKIGKRLAGYTEKGLDNVERVFANADGRLKRRRKETGDFPMRIVREVARQAFVCEDELQGSYLGGILASSRTKISRDDRAASYLSILDSLSTYQIRTHAILYSAILRIAPNEFSRGKKWIVRGDATVMILDKDYRRGMEFTKKEPVDSIVPHALNGLEQKKLIEGSRSAMITVNPERMGGPFITPPKAVLNRSLMRCFFPTALGIELFLWGVGYGDKGIEAYAPQLLERTGFPIKVLPHNIVFGQVTYPPVD
jgi:hypothetical protein